jgi:hypothetical protein
MPLQFTLPNRIAGLTTTNAGPGERLIIMTTSLLLPFDPELTNRLDQLQGALFGFIPGFPDASAIRQLVVVVKPDLAGTAYLNEDLNITAHVKVNRSIEAGEAVLARDIDDVTHLQLGVDVPTDAAVVVMLARDWRRSLYFDFGPLAPSPQSRTTPLSQSLARQMLGLIGIPQPQVGSAIPPGSPGSIVSQMAEGFQRLRTLLDSECKVEGEYQALLERNAWMLGGLYGSVVRHKKLDDARIPDFTAIRVSDKCHDVVELKQPFLKCSTEAGAFSAEFNGAWNQAETYLGFVRRNRDYLRNEKQFRFENPRALIIAGYRLEEDVLRSIREKESMNLGITFLTYDQVLEMAQHILFLTRIAEAATESPRSGPRAG